MQKLFLELLIIVLVATVMYLMGFNKMFTGTVTVLLLLNLLDKADDLDD